MEDKENQKKKLDFSRPHIIVGSIAAGNYFWFLVLHQIFRLVGHEPEKAAVFSFVVWFLTLPATFWVVYYYLLNYFKTKKASSDWD